MNNEEIRLAISKSRLRYFEVARKLNITPSTFSVWLRAELEGARKEKVMSAINELSEEVRKGVSHG